MLCFHVKLFSGWLARVSLIVLGGTFFSSCAFALLPGSPAHAPLVARAPQVTIEAGTLEGALLDHAPRTGAFLGIPYAAQPVGDLRWKPPQPPPAWSGVRTALHYGPACPQLPSPWLPEMLGIKKMATDEACLYLNVWTTNLNSGSSVPVMVWIHGGGNVEGSGEWPPLGATLAREGVVVVSINYRLRALGFFANPSLSAESPHHVSGNYGLMDQVAALKWVQKNIRHFGGDPRQVTVFGASSGALDICNLMASPLAKGLFQRAIMQSGVCVDSVFPTLPEAGANGARLLSDLGVKAGPHAMAELRAIPAERILQVAASDQQLDMEPVMDGWFFREQPAVTFAEGSQAKVPVIVGSNRDEVSIFASPLVGGTSYRPRTVAQYKRWLSAEFKGHADEVFAAYPASTDSAVASAFRQMNTDFDFGFGAWLLARDTSHIGENAFLYRFDYVGAGEFAALGAFHSEESMFLSKKYWTSWIRRPYDETLSNAIIGYWVQFAKTGNPNRPGLPAWPIYDSKADLAQQLGLRIGPEAVPRADRYQVFQRFLTFRLQQAQK